MAQSVSFLMRLVRLVGIQPWLRLGLRRRLVRALFPEGTVSERRFSTSFRGYRYDGSFSSNIDWQVFFFGGYELAELAVIEDVTAAIDGCVSLDVGANTGQHALVMAKYSAAVHAFEPFPLVRDLALGHLQRNQLSHVTMHPFGLATEARTATYRFDSRSRNLGTGSFVGTHNSSADTEVNLEIRRGDEWFAGIGLTRADFVKIDVEGFEAEVVAGLQATLAAHQPVMMVEVTQSAVKGLERRGGLSALLPYPVRLFRVLKPLPRAVLFSDGGYRLAPITEPKAEAASYNLLIVPESRLPTVGKLLPS
jgi:FkbM family methyltransferase